MTTAAPLLKVADVARKTGFSEALIMRLARGRLIPAYFISKKIIRFDPEENYKKLISKATVEIRTLPVRKMKEEAAANEKNFCEACGWEPGIHILRGHTILEYHHVLPLRYGGLDEKKNLVLLCPTCHRVAHKIFPRGPMGCKTTEEYLLDLKTRGESSYQKAINIIQDKT